MKILLCTLFLSLSLLKVCFSNQAELIPVRFTEKSPISDLSGIDKALKQAVDMSESGGELELTEPFDMESDPNVFNQKKVKVTTCVEYFEMKDKGFSAETTYDITMESWFIDKCIPLRLFKKAKPSNVTYLNEDFLTKNPLKSLPLDLALTLSSDEEANLKLAKSKGLNLKQFIPDISVQEVDKNHIILKSGQDGTIYVDVIAFGDFNADGIEDALVSVSHYVAKGSYRDFGIHLLTKLQPNDRLSVIETP